MLDAEQHLSIEVPHNMTMCITKTKIKNKLNQYVGACHTATVKARIILLNKQKTKPIFLVMTKSTCKLNNVLVPP